MKKVQHYKNKTFRWMRAWAGLTVQERLFVGGILLIAFIGFIARRQHLKHEKPEPYDPFGFEHVALNDEKDEF